jgi:hypothetical protein
MMAAVNRDDIKIRCPRLGGPVPFSYCEQTGRNGQPCFKVMDCWWQHFDVVAYLKKRFSTEELAELFTQQPRPKLTGILELIEQARQNSTPDPSD